MNLQLQFDMISALGTKTVSNLFFNFDDYTKKLPR